MRNLAGLKNLRTGYKMYKITFKGQDLTPVYVDDKSGDLLMKDWENGTMGETVKINNGVYRSSYIKSINRDSSDENIENRGKMQSEAHKLYFKERQEALALDPAERGKRLGLFKLLWFAFEDSNNAPEEVLVRARKIQTDFFGCCGKNRTHCEPALFKHLFSKGKQFKSHIHAKTVGLVERTVAHDKFFDKKRSDYRSQKDMEFFEGLPEAQ